MLRCAASFVPAAYAKYASVLMLCAPCLRIFLRSRRFMENFSAFHAFTIFYLEPELDEELIVL